MNNKFIIFKASGGLTHMFILLSQVIYLSKLLKRYLIIDCETHSAFSKDFSDYFIIKDKELLYSSEYKDVPINYKFHGINIETIKKSKIKFNTVDKNYYIENIPLKFNIENIDNDIIVLSKYDMIDTFICNNIKLKKKILNSIKKRRIKNKYISVHFRNTDIHNDIYKFIDKIKNSIIHNNIKTVYLATDDSKAFSVIKKELPDIKLIQYTIPNDFNGGNIHYNTKDKDKLIYNCLLDMYMMLNSNIFIPSNNSGLSKWIIKIINSRNSDNIFNIKSNTILFNEDFDVIKFISQPFYGNRDYSKPIKIEIIKDNVVKVTSEYKWKEDMGLLDVNRKKILFQKLGRRSIKKDGIVYDRNGSTWSVDKR